MKDTLDFLNKQLNDNDSIIVATSGGPDSMCLLSLVTSLNKNLNIICAHVNHNTRKQTIEEYEYVENYCKEKNIIFEGMEIVAKIESNFEAEARKIRYEFFKSLKSKYNAKYILTAHHADDLIETILMRITRGSNLSGYIGIKMIDNDYLRPLLNLTKKDILDYLAKNNIKYYIDKSNNSLHHTRNRYRKHVLPFLKKENPNISNKYLQFSKELTKYDNFVSSYILENNLINNNSIDLNKINFEKEFVLIKCIEKIIKDIQKNDLLDISNPVMESIIKLCFSNKSNGYIDLSNNYITQKNYNILTIIKKQEYSDYKIMFDTYFENELFIIKRIYEDKNNSNNIIKINSSEIKLPLYFRNMLPKDVMEVKNLGHKKVKDIFIDSKVNINERKVYPILVDSDDKILWIPGIKKSKFDKDKSQKYDIILFSERNK